MQNPFKAKYECAGPGASYEPSELKTGREIQGVCDWRVQIGPYAHRIFLSSMHRKLQSRRFMAANGISGRARPVNFWKRLRYWSTIQDCPRHSFRPPTCPFRISAVTNDLRPSVCFALAVPGRNRSEAIVGVWLSADSGPTSTLVRHSTS